MPEDKRSLEILCIVLAIGNVRSVKWWLWRSAEHRAIG